MIRFENIWAFYLTALLLVISLLFLWYSKWRKSAFKRYSDHEFKSTNFHLYSSKRHWIKQLLIMLSLSFLILALANLQLGGKLKEGKSKGVEMIVAVDVSKSMLAEDLKPNRLTHAKRTIDALLRKLKGDQVGLVVFAGNAYVQVPITSDYSAIKSSLKIVEPGMIPVQGTSFKSAIELCLESFKSDSPNNKAIVLLTDGENHEDGAIDAAAEALAEGVRVYTIGMGGTEGVPIPLKRGNTNIGYLKDQEGNTVVSALNPEVLNEIAQSGGGRYISAKTTRSSLNLLFQEIQKLDEQEFETKVYEDFEDRYQYFLLPGILFLFFYLSFWERKSKWM